MSQKIKKTTKILAFLPFIPQHSFYMSRTDRQVLLWLCYIILIKGFIDAYISYEIPMLVGNTEF